MSFDQRELRDALGVYPTGVSVVTARAPDGHLVGVTVGSFTSVSLEPPLVSFSLSKKLYSAAKVLEADLFAINVLHEDQTDVSTVFAGAGTAKWDGLEPREGAAGCPVLEDCMAVFECAKHACFDGGDHVIVLGRILNFETDARNRPLLFFRGKYHGVRQEL